MVKEKVEAWVYTIDRHDVITTYSKNFVQFAISNGWTLRSPEREIIGRNVFDFIEGYETKHIYKILFDLVRQGKRIGPIPFRCDAPGLRRFLELCLDPMPDSAIKITTKLLREEPRTPVKALMKDLERSQKLIRMCSMCKKIEAGDKMWLEIEEGLVVLKIFEDKNPPRITHGLCHECFSNIMVKIEKLKQSA